MASRPPQLLDRSTARAYTAANLLVLPGFGSFLAGKRVTGLLQAVLALAGFGLTGFWFVTFLGAWLQTQAFPTDGGPQFRLGLIGVLLFLAAWLWALVTSLRILRATRTTSA